MTDATLPVIPGFERFVGRLNETSAYAFGHVKVLGSLYFIRVEFVRREDGSYRERLFSRRTETFCGRPIRGRAATRVADMAEAFSEAILPVLSASLAVL